MFASIKAIREVSSLHIFFAISHQMFFRVPFQWSRSNERGGSIHFTNLHKSDISYRPTISAVEDVKASSKSAEKVKQEVVLMRLFDERIEFPMASNFHCSSISRFVFLFAHRTIVCSHVVFHQQKKGGKTNNNIDFFFLPSSILNNSADEKL